MLFLLLLLLLLLLRFGPPRNLAAALSVWITNMLDYIDKVKASREAMMAKQRDGA